MKLYPQGKSHIGASDDMWRILGLINELLRRNLAPKSRNKDIVSIHYYEIISAVLTVKGWTVPLVRLSLAERSFG